jgi:hypothetical protein
MLGDPIEDPEGLGALTKFSHKVGRASAISPYAADLHGTIVPARMAGLLARAFYDLSHFIGEAVRHRTRQAHQLAA